MKPFALELRRDRVNIEDSSLSSPVLSYIVAKKLWQLEEAYPYQDGQFTITVPALFQFDLASIPRPFWWLMAPFELSISAPLIHDFLYRHKGDPPADAIAPPRVYTRKESDCVFREIMRKEGVWEWRCFAAYHAVRIFGGAAWGGRNRNGKVRFAKPLRS